MDWIYDIFEFSKKYPMDFTQMSFWIFFVIIYIGFALVYKLIFIAAFSITKPADYSYFY